MLPQLLSSPNNLDKVGRQPTTRFAAVPLLRVLRPHRLFLPDCCCYCHIAPDLSCTMKNQVKLPGLLKLTRTIHQQKRKNSSSLFAAVVVVGTTCCVGCCK